MKPVEDSLKEAYEAMEKASFNKLLENETKANNLKIESSKL